MTQKGKPMEIFLHKDETYGIIGACFEVYKEKGCGFLEAVYQECMEIELGLQGIPFAAKKPLRLEYKGRPLRQAYEPDLICFEKIIVELKAVSVLADEHRAQVINYSTPTTAGLARRPPSRTSPGRLLDTCPIWLFFRNGPLPCPTRT
jgi:GxxExxY protein